MKMSHLSLSNDGDPATSIASYDPEGKTWLQNVTIKGEEAFTIKQVTLPSPPLRATALRLRDSA